MYQPHTTNWVLFAFALFLVLAVLAFYLRQEKKLGLPAWVAPGLAVLAALQIAGVGILRVLDERALREELRRLSRDKITRLVLSRDGTSRVLSAPREIAVLMVWIQSLEYVGAHHSHPTDLVDLEIDTGNQAYHYQVGRDSARVDEYWVLERGRSFGSMGREIGRVHSAQLGPLLDKLLLAPK